ncbi:DMT family transporter [Pseudonocardia xinjiangensis]|uniref:DMT family transporter n=1 Tax=Pseudonocardia xinjiangensis TaxID=75289 RepID=UPI003D8B81EB
MKVSPARTGACADSVDAGADAGPTAPGDADVATGRRWCSAEVRKSRAGRLRASGKALLFGALPGALFIVIWSSGYLVGKIGMREMPALTLLWWRFLVAAVVMGVVALVTRAPWPRRPMAWIHLIVTGLVLHAVQFGGIYIGLDLGVSAGLASLIASAGPLVIAAIAVPVFGEVLQKRQWVGLLLGLLGVAAAVSSELGGGVSGAGLIALLVSLAAFAGGTLYQKRFGAVMDLRTGLTVQLVVATASITPLALGPGGLSVPVTFSAIWPIVWVSVVSSIGGLVLLFTLLRRRGGGAATSYLFLVPPVTALAAIPLLGQPLQVGAMIGTALAAVGVALVTRSGRQAAE